MSERVCKPEAFLAWCLTLEQLSTHSPPARTTSPRSQDYILFVSLSANGWGKRVELV
jgi:hypothetical protein